MISKTTIQLLLIIISGVIIASYISPTFDSMRATQDETQEYREALDNAEKFNQELTRLLNAANELTTSERQALTRYLPNEVDTISVMRDIETIANNNQMSILNLSTAEEEVVPFFIPAQGQPQEERSALNATTFSVGLFGSYEAFKRFLRDVERNAYPLEVTSLQFSSTNGSNLYSYVLKLETFSLDVTSTNELEQ